MAQKNPAAVALGRRGGEARAKNLTSQERSEAARKAVEARWAKQHAHLKSLVDDITSRTKELERTARKKKARESKKASA